MTHTIISIAGNLPGVIMGVVASYMDMAAPRVFFGWCPARKASIIAPIEDIRKSNGTYSPAKESF